MNPETEFREGLDELANHYKDILQLLGEDPQREGLLKTPARVAKSMLWLTQGYRQDPLAVLHSAKFHATIFIRIKERHFRFVWV